MADVEVVKFGGSTQKTKDDFFENYQYIMNKIYSGKIVIPVVSAPYGVTDMLKSVWKERGSKTIYDGEKKLNEVCEELEEKYAEILGEEYREVMRIRVGELKNLYDGKRKAEFITAGEDHSGIIYCLLFQMYDQNAAYFDGFKAGLYSKFGSKKGIDIKETLSRGKLEELVKKALNNIVFIGGYRGIVGSTKDFPVQLPDNSTDATASMVAAAAKKTGANVAVEMIKDVPGVKEINFAGIESKIIEKLNYREAIEVATKGAEVIYPPAIDIARKFEIPILVKNKKSKGTLISNESGTSESRPFAAMSVEKRYQINFIDPAMILEPESVGYFSKITSALAERGIDISYTPDSAETITLTVDEKYSEIDSLPLEDYLGKIFNYLDAEIRGKEIYLVSIIGESMRKPGTLEKVARILGDNNVSIKSLSQPEEDVAVPSITLGIEPKDIEKAVKELYSGLFLELDIKKTLARQLVNENRDEHHL